MVKAPEQQETAQINVVLNWFEELKQRVPTRVLRLAELLKLKEWSSEFGLKGCVA